MQTGKRFAKYSAFAIAALLLISFVAVGNASAGNNDKIKFVETAHLKGGITIEPQDLAFLLESGIEIPEDILIQLMSVEEISIYVDGLAHVNMIASEKNGVLDVHLHAFWHGTILIQAEGLPDILLDFKNAQLMLHVSVSCTSDEFDVNANLHTNGEMVIGDASDGLTLDLDFKVRIMIQDGELKNFRLSVPEWFELVFV